MRMRRTLPAALIVGGLLLAVARGQQGPTPIGRIGVGVVDMTRVFETAQMPQDLERIFGQENAVVEATSGLGNALLLGFRRNGLIGVLHHPHALQRARADGGAEVTTSVWLALDELHVPAQQTRQPLADDQPEARSPESTGHGAIGLAEHREYARCLLRGHADPRVPYVELQPGGIPFLEQARGELDAPDLSELDGVRHQVHEDLA